MDWKIGTALAVSFCISLAISITIWRRRTIGVTEKIALIAITFIPFAGPIIVQFMGAELRAQPEWLRSRSRGDITHLTISMMADRRDEQDADADVDTPSADSRWQETSSDERVEILASQVGIFAFRDFDRQYRRLCPEADPDAIGPALDVPDWRKDTCQLLVVKAPGVMMEVSGRLGRHDGLSIRHVDIAKGKSAQVFGPTQSFDDVASRLRAFLEDDA
jgi:hypothetical protein